MVPNYYTTTSQKNKTISVPKMPHSFEFAGPARYFAETLLTYYPFIIHFQHPIKAASDYVYDSSALLQNGTAAPAVADMEKEKKGRPINSLSRLTDNPFIV